MFRKGERAMDKKNNIIKYVLIAVSILFVGIMLVLPLIAIIANSLQKGWTFYIRSLTDKYVLSALKITVIATISALIINTFLEWRQHGFSQSFHFVGNIYWQR